MSSETLILFPPFCLDVRNEQLWRDDELLSVRPKPFAVLAYLAAHPGRLVMAGELRKAIWPNTYVGEGLLRGYIREVRIVLGDDPETPRFIETVPRRGYRFLAEVASSPPPLTQHSAPSTQHSVLVGRERELTQLHGWFARAVSGERQLVFVTGEPGIGKTTLIDAFLLGLGQERTGDGPPTLSQREPATGRRPQAKPSVFSPLPDALSPAPGVWVGRGQCIEHYGSGEAYLPVLEAVGQLCRQPGGEQVVALLRRYAPTWLMQMPALLDDVEFETLQRKVQGATRERMLREMAEALEALTAEQPLVLIIEDLHWGDSSTLDFLSLLTQRRGLARVLLLATYRPTDVIVSGHPLKALKQELQGRGQCEEVSLGFLGVAEIRQYLTVRFPQPQFPANLAVLLHQSTEGNPLFMVTVVDEWVRQGVLVETDGQWRMTTKIADLATGVPESLRQLIEKQLERLPPDEQQMLEAASVVGGEFTATAVAAGLEEQDARVEERCEQLVRRAQFLHLRGIDTSAGGTVMGRYGFLHALYPQVLYERLAPARRVHLHRRIAAGEERAYGARAEEHAAELAMHFESGHDYARAVHYCYQAGQQAQQRFAAAEAAQHFRHGLALLATLPKTRERQELELAMLTALGLTLWATDSEVGAVYARASALAQHLGLPVQRFIALDGLVRWHFLRGEFQQAKELAEQSLTLAQHRNDPVLHVKAAAIRAAVMLHSGAPRAAYDGTVEVLAQYDALPTRFALMQYGEDPKVSLLSAQALALWLLGRPEQARQQSLAALQWATELASPFGIVLAHCFITIIQQCIGDETTSSEWAAETVSLAHEHGSHLWEEIGRILRGWSLVAQGQPDAGWTQLQQGEHLRQTVEGKAFRSYTLALLADAYRRTRQVEAGLATVTEALTCVEQTGEQFWEAELWRLKGELLLQQQKSTSPKPHDAPRQTRGNKRSKARVSPTSRARSISRS